MPLFIKIVTTGLIVIASFIGVKWALKFMISLLISLVILAIATTIYRQKQV